MWWYWVSLFWCLQCTHEQKKKAGGKELFNKKHFRFRFLLSFSLHHLIIFLYFLYHFIAFYCIDYCFIWYDDTIIRKMISNFIEIYSIKEFLNVPGIWFHLFSKCSNKNVKTQITSQYFFDLDLLKKILTIFVNLLIHICSKATYDNLPKSMAKLNNHSIIKYTFSS